MNDYHGVWSTNFPRLPLQADLSLPSVSRRVYESDGDPSVEPIESVLEVRNNE